jgi:hypothetical protein
MKMFLVTALQPNLRDPLRQACGQGGGDGNKCILNLDGELYVKNVREKTQVRPRHSSSG